MRKELLLGSGASRQKVMFVRQWETWSDLTTLDLNPDHNPMVLWDLEKLPLPFEDDAFDEIHAYHVLEHTGSQGDWRFFFAQFEDFHRILKRDGLFFAQVPLWNSVWAWGDPSHKRIINRGTLAFLDQAEYERQVGITNMTDYRFVYKANFERMHVEDVDDELRFVLRAVK